MNRKIPAVIVPPATEEWRAQAACHNAGELFFAPESDGPGPAHWDPEPARRICRLCPVHMECLRTALSREDRAHKVHGMWGGYTAPQRWQLRRCLTSTCQHEDPAHCMEALL